MVIAIGSYPIGRRFESHRRYQSKEKGTPCALLFAFYFGSWAGTPELAISDVINCYSLQDEKNGVESGSSVEDTNRYAYESYSNEFTINSGLRVKSKLRKI